MTVNEKDILFRTIKRIPVPRGDVLHGIRKTDPGFNGFGEAYFSYIHFQTVKAWKLHTRYTANFICPYGKVKIVVCQKNLSTFSDAKPKEFLLSEDSESYQCLTVPPGVWYGFMGLAKPTSLVFSLLNGEHSEEEKESLQIADLPYEWGTEIT